MIFLEPEGTYNQRSAKLETEQVEERKCDIHDIYGPLSYENGWDEWIIGSLSSAPGKRVRLISLVSRLRKCVRHRDKHHKEKIKREILHRFVL